MTLIWQGVIFVSLEHFIALCSVAMYPIACSGIVRLIPINSKQVWNAFNYLLPSQS